MGSRNSMISAMDQSPAAQLAEAKDLIEAMSETLSAEQRAKEMSSRLAALGSYPVATGTLEKSGSTPEEEHLRSVFGTTPLKLENRNATKKNNDANKPSSTSQSSQGGQGAKPKQDGRPSAIGMKVADAVSAEKLKSLAKDTRSGILPNGSYTVTDYFKNSQSLAQLDDDVRSRVVEMWINDGWGSLVNPPEWLTFGHFVLGIPTNMNNQRATMLMVLARYNLQLARVRMTNDPEKISAILDSAPDVGSFMTGALLGAVDTLTKSLKNMEDRQGAMLAVAAQNLAHTEQQICHVKNTINGVYSDAFSTIEQKMEVLTKTIEQLTGLSDVEQGASMRGASSQASVSTKQTPSVSGVSSQSSRATSSASVKQPTKTAPKPSVSTGGRL